MSGDVRVRFCEGLGVRLPRATRRVCAFQYERDAERFYRVVGKRLGKYGRELSPEQTRLLGCSRHQTDAESRCDFRGLTCLWGKDRTVEAEESAVQLHRLDETGEKPARAGPDEGTQ